MGNIEDDPGTSELRKTGISVIGDLPWSTHFYHFYETKQDLLDSLVPYFKAGLENKEYCLWLISDPLTLKEAGRALRRAVPDLDRYLAEQSIEILPHAEWFLEGGPFDLDRVIEALREKLDQALARGYPGMRFSGNPGWLGKNNGMKTLLDYEKALDRLAAGHPILMSCTFQLATSEATEVFEMVRTHQLVGAMRHGKWEVLETPELRRTKAELKRLSEELEERVLERTRELEAVNENLRKEAAELRREEERIAHMAALVQFSDDAVYGKTLDGIITSWNKAAERVYGYSESEAVGKPVSILVTRDDEEVEILGKIKLGEHLENYETVRRRKDGQSLYMSLTISPVKDMEGRIIGASSIGRDITARKQAEEALRKKEQELEESALALDQANAALKVLLKHREEDKTAMENAILRNVKESIFPYVEKLKGARLTGSQATYVSIIESGLNDIISPFLQKMAAKYSHFTPMEIQVANLIKTGRTSKEISQILGVSKRTVDSHRDNIRKKLDLGSKKINLQSYLDSLNNT